MNQETINLILGGIIGFTPTIITLIINLIREDKNRKRQLEDYKLKKAEQIVDLRVQQIENGLKEFIDVVIDTEESLKQNKEIEDIQSKLSSGTFLSAIYKLPIKSLCMPEIDNLTDQFIDKLMKISQLCVVIKMNRWKENYNDLMYEYNENAFELILLYNICLNLFDNYRIHQPAKLINEEVFQNNDIYYKSYKKYNNVN